MSAKVETPAATVMPDTQQPPPAQWTTNMTAGSLTASIGNSCLDEQIERLKRCEYLREGEVKALCLRAREILVDESNVQRVDAPVTVRTCFMCSWRRNRVIQCRCLMGRAMLCDALF
jgi:hypothetical protein